MENLGINLGYILLQIFMFAIVLVVLRAWVYQPIMKMLEKRRATINQGLEDARIAGDARANAELEAEKILAEAQTKANDVIRAASERAVVVERELRAQADAGITKSREAALAEVDQERTRYLSDLRSQVASLAIAATQKLIGEALDEKRQRALLDEFFSGIKSGKVVVLDNVSLKGNAAEVVSALPLTQAEQTKVKDDVLASLGGKGEIKFKVDPSILGGLVIRVGDRVVDGSVAGQLNELKNSLQ
ncbi:MAG TPA: F0F1 ATP synthase subunit B [Longilinea sp.]|nr:F0F1 ATP synthase subunit B [Longilinea sp.]